MRIERSGKGRMMKKYISMWTLAGLLAAGGLQYAAADTPPNCILILADDLGYADVGFNGCEDIPTPHIDSIAAAGAQCTSAYVTYSVCGPSRAGLITGRYQGRFGFGRNPQYRPDDPNMGLPLSEQTLASALKQAGYTSGIIGKWHLGAHPSLHPLNRGFDYFFGHLGGGHQYFSDQLTIRDSYSIQDEAESYRTWILRNHTPVQITKYLTDEFSDEAVAFIKRSKDRPFFLYLSYNAPHAPMQAPEEVKQRFSGIRNEKRRTYAAMVSVMDEGIGRVLATLRELNLEKNTLVFFLSDNGGPTGANASDNRPLRGKKSDVWEGGFRVPFAVRWPGRIPAGTVYEQPLSALDIFATMSALAGVESDPARPLDGVSLIPYLTGANQSAPHDTIYLRKFDQQRYAIRHGDYKLVIPVEGGTPELYNLADDIGEDNNLSAALPEKVQTLDTLRKQWVSELVHPVFLGLIHTESNIKRWGRPKRWLPGMEAADPAPAAAASEAVAPKEAAPFEFPVSRDVFVEQNREWSRHPVKGWAFDPMKTEARFDELDIDGNGLITQAEWDLRDGAPAEKAAPAAPEPAAQLPEWEIRIPADLNEFLRVNRVWAAHPQKGWSFDRAVTEERFHWMDIDQDGILSQSEWDAR